MSLTKLIIVCPVRLHFDGFFVHLTLNSENQSKSKSNAILNVEKISQRRHKKSIIKIPDRFASDLLQPSEKIVIK